MFTFSGLSQNQASFVSCPSCDLCFEKKRVKFTHFWVYGCFKDLDPDVIMVKHFGTLGQHNQNIFTCICVKSNQNIALDSMWGLIKSDILPPSGGGQVLNVTAPYS